MKKKSNLNLLKSRRGSKKLSEIKKTVFFNENIT